MLDPTPFVGDAAAATVLKLLAEQRWRKARDAAKDLWKRDHARYLPLLLEANAGLAREMHAKGLDGEAATVLAYLKTIAPAECIASLELELTTPVKPTQGTPDRNVNWETALRAQSELDRGRIPSAADLAATDLLVTGDFTPTAIADPVAAGVAEALIAVRKAVAATGNGDWDSARDALRTVPATSVFRHWRMFLRGVRCHFEHDRKTARQCFDSLPPGGSLHRAARAISPHAAPPGPTAPTPARIPLYLAMTGEPANWSTPILNAQTACRNRKRLAAFKELRNGLKAVFPAESPGLPALLTEAICNLNRSGSDEDQQAFEDICNHFTNHPPTKPSSPESELAIVRIVAINSDIAPDHPHPSFTPIELCWNHLVSEYLRIHRPPPAGEAALWHAFGDACLRNASSITPSFMGPRNGRHQFRVKCAKKALAVLEKAVTADPTHEEAWMAQLDALDVIDDLKGINKLLESLSKRFPHNKIVVLANARHAKVRKAYDKAIKAYKAVLAIDPLDRTVRCELASILILKGHETAIKGRATDAIWDALEPLLEDRPEPEEILLARWLARIRRASLTADPQAALAARNEAFQTTPSPVEVLFAELQYASLFNRKLRDGWKPDWDKALTHPRISWNTPRNLIEINHSHTLFGKANRMPDQASCDRLADVTATLIKDGPIPHAHAILSLIDWCENHRSAASCQGREAMRNILQPIKATLVSLKLTKRLAAHPALHLASLLIAEILGRWNYRNTKRQENELDAIIQAATTAGDTLAQQRAQHLKTLWQQEASHAFMDVPDSGYAFDDDDDDEDEDDDDDYEDDGEEFDPDSPADKFLIEKLGGHLEALAKAADNGDTEAASILEDLQAVASSLGAELEENDLPPTAKKTKKPATKAKPKTKPKSKRTPNDDGQGTLF